MPTHEAGPVASILLGAIQGLTEFLPVSSDGHLALAQHAFGLHDALARTVLLHLGTLAATLLVFREDVKALLLESVAVLKDPSRLRREPRGQELAAIVLTSVPTAVIGLALKHRVEAWSEVPWIVAVCLLGTAAVLWMSGYGRERQPWTWTPGVALLLGVAQGLAVLPGLSRSACTLSAALLLGAPAFEAFRYSFVASLPAVAGALLLETVKGDVGRAADANGLLGAAVAFVVGLGALLMLRGVVRRGRLRWFVAYVVPLAIAVLALAARPTP